MPNLSLNIYVCSICNLACHECSMQHHMRAYSDYQLTLDSLSQFLAACEQSQYVFDCHISGGEPLLWTELDAGVAMLRQSPAIAELGIFTNALAHARLSAATGSLFDNIRVSAYGYNDAAVETIKQRYPTKVKITPKYGFWRNPREAVPTEFAWPVQCECRSIMFYDNRVYGCPNIISVSRPMPSAPDPTSLSVPVATGFLDQIANKRAEYASEACRRCVANVGVRRWHDNTMDANVSDNRKQSEIQEEQLIQLHIKHMPGIPIRKADLVK